MNLIHDSINFLIPFVVNWTSYSFHYFASPVVEIVLPYLRSCFQIFPPSFETFLVIVPCLFLVRVFMLSLNLKFNAKLVNFVIFNHRLHMGNHQALYSPDLDQSVFFSVQEIEIVALWNPFSVDRRFKRKYSSSRSYQKVLKNNFLMTGKYDSHLIGIRGLYWRRRNQYEQLIKYFAFYLQFLIVFCDKSFFHEYTFIFHHH